MAGAGAPSLEPAAAKVRVPQGFAAIRADFAHFSAMHGASGFWQRLWVLGISRSFWGLALYRLARSIYALPRSKLTLPLRGFYNVAYEIVRRITKVSMDPRADLGERVWIAPHGEVFITQGASIGPGSSLCGGNTLGLGGRPGARGKPQLGANVTLAPGAAAVGPVSLPDGTVLGANSLCGRSLPHAAGWLGAPPRVHDAALVPARRTLCPTGSAEETQMREPEPFWPNYRADLERHLVYHPGASRLKKLRLALTLDGSWAMALYRFGRSLRTNPPNRVLAPLLWAAYRLGEIFMGILTSIYIDVDAVIAPGLYVGHFVQLHIGAGVRIGKNSSVSQMVTIAAQDGRPGAAAPVLGERVYVGSGAKVIGALRVADGAAICANAVIVSDVPENGVVLGNPGVVISRRGSGDFIFLGGGDGVRDEIIPLEQLKAS